jgi:hypothetical protein
MILNTRVIMTVSAIYLALMGIILSFMPNEVAEFIGLQNSKTIQLILQIAGAQYFAMALLNWMKRTSVIGGIYNRPVSITNYTHYVIGTLASWKLLLGKAGLPSVFWILAAFYLIFAFLYGFIFYRNPVLS